MTELVPFLQLGFAAVMAIALFMLVKSYMDSMLAQNARLVQYVAESSAKVSMVLENHLTAIAMNQAKTAESLDQIQNRLLDALIKNGVRPAATPPPGA